VYVLLFGTGIRNLKTTAAAKVGGMAVPVLAVAPQPQYAGLDQVTLGPLPRSLAGKGAVDIELTVDGVVTNLVTMSIQ
jgi:uncharacterized protein (TIGR03437 family)